MEMKFITILVISQANYFSVLRCDTISEVFSTFQRKIHYYVRYVALESCWSDKYIYTYKVTVNSCQSESVGKLTNPWYKNNLKMRYSWSFCAKMIILHLRFIIYATFNNDIHTDCRYIVLIEFLGNKIIKILCRFKGEWIN